MSLENRKIKNEETRMLKIGWGGRNRGVITAKYKVKLHVLGGSPDSALGLLLALHTGVSYMSE